jgi:hypothetical protein
MLRVLWRTDVRVNELLTVTPRDIEANNSVVNVTKAKGGKHREVFQFVLKGRTCVPACLVMSAGEMDPALELSISLSELARTSDFQNCAVAACTFCVMVTALFCGAYDILYTSNDY